MQKRVNIIVLAVLLACMAVATPAFAAKESTIPKFAKTLCDQIKLNIVTSSKDELKKVPTGGNFQMLDSKNMLLTPNKYTRGQFSIVFIPTETLKTFEKNKFERIFFQPSANSLIVGISPKQAEGITKDYISVGVKEFNKRPKGSVSASWTINTDNNKNKTLRLGFPLNDKYDISDICLVKRVNNGWAVIEGIEMYIDNKSSPSFLFTEYCLGSGTYSIIKEDGSPKMSINISDLNPKSDNQKETSEYVDLDSGNFETIE